jgi:pimeloyl-ACP methyl ester carboxylesterase
MPGNFGPSSGLPRRTFIAGAAAATTAVALAGCSEPTEFLGAATPLAIERRYVMSGTAVLEVKIVGAGTPIVLVPGFARGASDFEEIMQGLAARGYRAIAVNARGCEGSTGPWARTTIYEIADDLYAVIKDLGLGPVHVVGHAAGGRYARMLATRNPENVKTVIILSSGGKFEDKERFATFFGAVMKTIAGEISPAEMDAAMLASGAFAAGNDPSPWRTGWWPVATAQAKGGENVKAEEYSQAGGRPMLALYGKEDMVAPPRNSLALKDELAGQVTVMGLDHAAHNMLQEQPTAIIEAIDDWIRSDLPR